MGEVVKFPVRDGRASGVFCKEAGLRFPVVYRIVQRLTAEMVEEFNLEDSGERNFVYYSLSDDLRRYPGAVESKEVTSVEPGDDFSIVIRHHDSMEDACSYLGALDDIGMNDYDVPVCRTDAGHFTLVKRKSCSRWPSCMIFYATFYNSPQTPGGFDHWELSAPAGGPLSRTDILTDPGE